MYDILIKNGKIVDGSGGAPYVADVAVKDGKIVKIGEIREDAEKVIDAAGRIVTPGFIDMHSHADLTVCLYPDAENLLGQGVTTVFTGHCGMGMATVGEYWTGMFEDTKAMQLVIPHDLASWFPGAYPCLDSPTMRRAFKERFGVEMDWTSFGDYREKLKSTGVGVNMNMLVGHSQVRISALGPDFKRPATQAEIDHMKADIAEAMEHGACGMSFGLDYDASNYAEDDEMYQLAEVVKSYGGIVAAHCQMRNERRGVKMEQHMLYGARELMELGLKVGVPVHISHICGGYNGCFGDQHMFDAGAERLLQLIDEYRAKGVRVTWDVLTIPVRAFYYFPQLASVLIYYISAAGGNKAFSEKLRSPGFRFYIAEKLKNKERIVFPRWNDSVEVTECKNSAYIGKSIRTLAEERGVSSEEMMVQILHEDIETCASYPLAPGLMETRVYENRPEASIGLDNCAFNYDYEGALPDMPADRSTPVSYCGMIKFLESQRDKPIEQTIRKLSGNAADNMRLRDRGYIRENMAADILVIDCENLRSNENLIDPRQRPDGFDYVIVNGRIAVDHGTHTHVRSGELL